MRTIKFRGKRIDNGEWAYGSLVTYSDIRIIGRYRNGHNKTEPYIRSFIIDNETGLEVSSYENEYYFTVMCEVIPETVGQFTELYDKNGKDIYEGDIMQICDDIAVVEFSANGFYQKSINDGPTYCNFNKYEVIGNIHDNPELLKTK